MPKGSISDHRLRPTESLLLLDPQIDHRMVPLAPCHHALAKDPHHRL